MNPPFTHLGTLTLNVGLTTVLSDVSCARKAVVDFADATLEGAHIRARKVEESPAGDWLSVGGGNVANVDVRLLLRTDDGAHVYLQLTGRTDAKRFDPVHVVATFDATTEKYAWLNLAVAAGVGHLQGKDVVVIELFVTR